MEDRRRAPRVDYKVKVALHTPDNFYVGFTGNISEGGLFIVTEVPQPIGSRIKVSFKLPDMKQEVQVEGEVRWIREAGASELPPGMGIKFLNLPEGAKRAIEKFIRKRTPEFFPDD